MDKCRRLVHVALSVSHQHRTANLRIPSHLVSGKVRKNFHSKPHLQAISLAELFADLQQFAYDKKRSLHIPAGPELLGDFSVQGFDWDGPAGV